MNRIAVVTGANRGIGREVARQLADQGDVVYLTARRLADAATAVAELGAVTNLHAHQLDVTDTASIDGLAATVEAEHRRLDVLINNAAILYDTWQRASAADLSVVHEALETNLFGVWGVTLALLPLLRRSEHAPDRERLERSRVTDSDGCRNTRVQHLEGRPERAHPDARRRVASRPHPRQLGRHRLGGHRHGWPWRWARRRRRRWHPLGCQPPRQRA